MATFSGKRKPTQKNRKGEILEDLPVFKGVTCAERNDRELARPIQLLNYQPITGKPAQPKEGCLKAVWESDPLIVLGAWESHVQGEGVDLTA